MKKLIRLFLFIILVNPCFAQQVIIGTGSAISVFSPLNRTNEYCAYEIIYLASDINTSGVISRFAFQRIDGNDTAMIDSVKLFMRHTTMTQLGDSVYSESGFQQVYEGQFPNDIGAGWREVALDVPFTYDGVSNLQVLVYKGFQAPVGTPPVCPRWVYTNISPAADRARRYYGSNPITSATPMSSTNFSSNARLDFGTVGVREIGFHGIQIFPNPTTDDVHIFFPAELKAELIISDVSGRMRIREAEVQSGQTFSIKDLSAGIYLITVRNDQTVYTSRLVKE